MQLLENAILERGRVKDGDVLKVDAFLNHQMDVALINELGKEFFRRFGDQGVTKILTIEASGIGIACITAQHFGVPVVFAKKTQSRNIDGEVLTSQVTSFTHQRNYDIIVSACFLDPSDRVLLIDDFLAKGSAMLGLISLVRQSWCANRWRWHLYRKGLRCWRRGDSQAWYPCGISCSHQGNA